MSDTEIMNTEQAADYMALSIGALRNMRYRGEGPRAIKVGRRLRFRKADLDAWLDSHYEPETV